MTTAADTRKSRFRAALALAGLTAEEWAAVQGITPSHLSRVLATKSTSGPLCDKVDAFARKWLGEPGVRPKAVKRVVVGHGAQ